MAPPCLRWLRLLWLLPLASGLVSPESCGVSRPLFKDASVKVDPIEGKGNWLQQGLSAVLGWVVKIPLPFLPGAPVAPAQPKRQEGLRCLMPYLMNCTHWHELSASRPCPQECPFIAQVKPFACAFTCVNVTQCRYTDPNMGFANPITQLCEESPIEGCEIQEEPQVCQKCREHFAINADGTLCLYDREGSIIWLVDHIHAMGYWAWVFVSALLLCCCWQLRAGLMKHWQLLTFARLHYHLCKVRKNPKVHAGAPLFSICENLHTKFVIGVGLPLYYNSLVFLLILSVLLFLGAHLALDSDSQSLFNYSGVSSSPVQFHGVPLYPSAEGTSDASICSWAMDDHGLTRFNVDTTAQGFMRRLSRSVLFLWFAAMLIMLAHAWFQLKHAKWFESQHLTMKDFALVLSGLPPEATDETQIAECISRQIGETVRSVSIGYDVTSRWGEVEVLLDRHLAFADAEARGGLPEGVGLRPRQASNMSSEEGSIQCWQDEDSATVREWFRPGSDAAMLGSGYAWLVFANHRDRDESLHKMLCLEKDGRGIVWEDPETGQRQVLDFGVPRCEPTNVRWEHLGLGICCRRALFLGALLLWLAAAGFLAISIYVPYAEYVTSFLEEAGKFPQGFMMGLLGFLIGLTWWAMCMMIGTCVNVAGFQTIEDENLFIFITFTIFCVAASAFNVYLTWYYTQDLWQHHTSSWFQRVKGFLLDTGGPVTTLRDLRKEIDFGFRVFQVLVPGVLFTPCLLSPLNNFLIPYFRESALLLLFGQGKSGREAERFLEPLPIGLAWDYQGHVTLPCCCCLTLFIMSPSMWWTQAYLCVWAFFFYFFQRFMHLRVCKKMYCTSNKLDSMVLYFGWGLLLAELAACHAYWRVRLQEWQWISILKAVALSYAVYWSLLWALGVPWPLRFRGELDRLERTRERSDDRCQSCEDFCYNWLNVNPVYVLKSQYCADEFGLDPCVFYEPGKEYLQLAPGDGDLHAAQSQRWKKASAGLWLEFEGLGCIAPICFDEVCTDVSSPTKSDSRNRLLRASEHDLSFGEADATPFLHDAKDYPSASAALAWVPGDQDPMDVSDFLEPSSLVLPTQNRVRGLRDVATPSTSSAAKREVPPDVNDAPEPSARDAARDQPNKQREAPSDADLQQLSPCSAVPSEPPPVGCKAARDASSGLEQSPSDAAAPSEPTPVQHEAPENASRLEQSPSHAAAPSQPTPVQHEAPENASKSLERSPSDAAAPSEPTPVQQKPPEFTSVPGTM